MGKKLEKFKKKLLKAVEEIEDTLEPNTEISVDLILTKPKRVKKLLSKEEITKLVKSVYKDL